MRIVAGILGLIGGLSLIWIGVHEILGEDPAPFPARGPGKNVVPLVCVLLIVVASRIAASAKTDEKTPLKPSDTARSSPPTAEVEQVRRFRVTTAREGGSGVEVHEVEGRTEEEATAFAVLNGLKVVRVEELPRESA